MAIREWPIFKKWFGTDDHPANGSKSHLSVFSDSVVKMRYKHYALNICISRLANAIVLCDFQTFIRGKPKMGDVWWKLNYEPNKNQNQSQFFYDLIYQMVYNYEEGALIVQTKDGQLIVAESFTMQRRAVASNLYSNIMLPGNLNYSGIYLEEDVIHLKLQNGKIKRIIDDVYEDYGRLLNDSIRNYNRGNAIKLKLNIDAQFEQFKSQDIYDEDGNVIGTEYDEILDEMFEDRYKAIFSDKDSLTPFENGLSIDEIKSAPGNTKSGAVTSRDITSIFDDILNLTADAFHIPRGIIKGDVADSESMRSNMIDDAIRPFIENIQTEFNRKLYGKEEFLKGSKMKIQTNQIYTKDPIAFANAAEAYLRIGVYCVNDILRMLGEELIEEDWAYEHYVTKNYESINQAKEAVDNAVNNLLGALKKGA